MSRVTAGQGSSPYQRCESREGLTCLKDSVCWLDCVFRGKGRGSCKENRGWRLKIGARLWGLSAAEIHMLFS